MFVEHATLTSERVEALTKQLGFLMPNLRGSKQLTRKLLANVVISKLFYTVPFWAPHMSKEGSGWQLCSGHSSGHYAAS